jgi:nucleoside 2-deoxyribosyltransferase
MSQEDVNQACPVCGENYLKSSKSLEAFSGFRNECERCGIYDIDKILIDIKDKPWSNVSHLVSAWVRRENNAGITPVIYKGAEIKDISNPEWWEKQFRYMGFPETTTEKLSALLLAYVAMTKGNYFANVAPEPRLIADIAAKNIEEVFGVTSLLSEIGYLKPYGNTKRSTFTARGWLHVEELKKLKTDSHSAFIAMWFSEHTRKYREAVIAAVEHCGYRPIIVDQEEYTGFIMDQVINLIRQAKFVIADFTCRAEIVNDGGIKNGVRGGVYWESGMAYGLGKPLIHTCEDDLESRARIHFDVDQYNTIYWRQEDLDVHIRSIDEVNRNPTFAEKLVARILALVGQGSYKPE